MEDDRFDRLTRELACTPGRRGVLKGILGLVGIATATSVAHPGATEAARRGFSGPKFPTPPPACPAGHTWCGSACVDTSADPANCGSCGTTCGGGGICVAGSCQTCLIDYASCSSGGQCCSGYCAIYGASGNQCQPCSATICSGFSCTDLWADDFNCGSCGNQCPSGTYCWAGQCQSDCFPPYVGGCTSNAQCCDTTAYCHPSSVCVGCAGTICGEGLCVDLATDPIHCGACNHLCGVGEYCYLANCVTCTPPGFDCTSDADCCTGTCQSFGASGSACVE